MMPTWQIELNEYSRACLAKHWPDVARFADIRSVPLNVLRGVDLVCGGFPCQDISVAGQQAGLDGERSRLWFDMLNVIERAQPRWVVVENSPALRTRGADTVLGGLEALDYSCWPLVVGAYAVGAPHRRERVWIVGYSGQQRRVAAAVREVRTRGRAVVSAGDLADAGITGCAGSRLERILDAERPARGSDANGRDHAVEHAESKGLERRGQRLPRRWPAGPVEPQADWEPSRTIKRPVGGNAHGFSSRLAERRRKRDIEALGAAVVPQVAEAIGRAILTVEQVEHEEGRRMHADLRELLG